MLLTIDIGNTNTVLGVFEGSTIVQTWRVKTDPRDTADELWLRFHSLLDGLAIDGSPSVQQFQHRCAKFVT